MGFLLSIQGTGSRLCLRTMSQRIVQAVVHEPLTDAEYRVAAHLKRLCYLLIGPARTRCVAINFEQDASMGQLAGRSFSFGNQLLQNMTLLLAQCHLMLVRSLSHKNPP